MPAACTHQESGITEGAWSGSGNSAQHRPEPYPERTRYPSKCPDGRVDGPLLESLPAFVVDVRAGCGLFLGVPRRFSRSAHTLPNLAQNFAGGFRLGHAEAGTALDRFSNTVL